MKKAYWLYYILSICCIAAGILLRDFSNALDLLLTLLGVALLLFTFARHCLSKAQRCPKCNAVIYSGHIRTIVRQKNGMIQCEKCGCLVCVNHSGRK